MRHILCAFMIVFLVSSNSFAEEKSGNPVEVFLGITTLMRVECTIGAETNTYSAIMECSGKNIHESKKYFAKAKKFTDKNKKITTMVKDYYAFWMTSMRAIVPAGEELQILYKQRIANDDRKLGEMRERIQLEF